MLTLYRNIFSPPRDLILVVAAIWIGLYLAEKRSSRYGINNDDLNNIVFYPLLGYLIGGRILYALENLSAFTQNPASLISLNLDLFDPVRRAGSGTHRCADLWTKKEACRCGRRWMR
jgi:hypothetical protein